jgi:hypothetical protein
MKPVQKKLRVLHYPQLPCKPFEVDVKSEAEAYLISNALASQHLYLLELGLIEDYSNIISVVMWDEDSDGEGNPDWVDYYNDDEMMEFGEFAETYLQS